MLRVGLTGGIASGKSTVASILRDSDCQVLELDPLGHEMLETGQPAYNEVVAEFGSEILEQVWQRGSRQARRDRVRRCDKAAAA